MRLLVFGVIILIGIHLVPTFPFVRSGLIHRLGEGLYKRGFAAVALLGLILMMIGKANADFVPLWQPPVWGRHVALVLVLFALVLLAAAYLPNNLKRFTRHPMLWGITLWSGGHLLANGDSASLVLFGSLGALSLFVMWSANMRGATKSKTKYSLSKDAIVVVIGLVAYGALVFLHPYLFGVTIIS